MLFSLFSFLIVGAISGWLSGLLGIGGGVIVVPLLVLILQHLHYIPDAQVMHLAVGSSLAAMIVTASRSVQSRMRLGLIDWTIIKSMLPGIIVGVLLGALLASELHSRVLEVILGFVLLLVALYMFLGSNPKQGKSRLNAKVTLLVSFLIGIKSGLLGLGGGAVIIPYLVICGVDMRKASGAAAACTLPVAIIGTIMYAFLGYGATQVPHTMGFVFLPAFFGIAIGSVVCVPLGLRASQRMNTKLLKKIFAVILFAVAIKMIM